MLTPGGYLPIDEIETGGHVWSRDEKTGTWDWKEVSGTLMHVHEGFIIRINVDGEPVHATENHPFCVAQGSGLWSRPVPTDIGSDALGCGGFGRWVAAGDLQTGDVLVGAGSWLTVESLISYGVSLPVYNLQVDEAHTYVVSTAGLLVHNKAAPFRKPLQIGPRWKPYEITDPRCQSGCERVADQIKKYVGGDVYRIQPKEGGFLGPYRGHNWLWGHHDVVRKGDRIYDAFTGHKGQSIDEYRRLWDMGDLLDFDTPRP